MNAGLLFEGIGGLGLGFERAGIAGDWSCEIDKDARQVLSDQWPFTPCFNDVKEIDGSAPRVDVLCGGFPCQDLSVAGNRAGLAGERSGLFHEFIRIAGALAPRWVVIENVPGLLSSGHLPTCTDRSGCTSCDPGADMGTVLGTLADLGYGWAYRVLDAQFFGVAQRRRRVFIVGCLGDSARAAEILFESTSCDGDPAPRREAGTRVAALTANGVGTCGADDNQGQAGHLIADTLRSHPRPGSNSNGSLALGFAHQAGGDSTSSGAFCEELSPTLQKSQTMAVAFHQAQDVATWDPRQVTSRDNRTTVEPGRPANTLHSTGLSIIGPSVRRLTPMECERLQGFPDGWTKSLSDSARYRTLGNAVAVPVAEWIGRRLMAAM